MIVTDRTITVRKGVATINEPVVLYRGDYEVVIRFKISNSKLKFMAGANMIESEKAAYGQLAILTPYGGNIFSSMTRCSEGAVAFVVTQDMLDQIEEVGLYSFQIRLFDANRESRITIPPVEFGIEIREPIASEDHDNEVNNAIVGYSIAKVVDPSEENVGPTFDHNGQYNKTDWKTGDRISQGKLNKIEEAIDQINQNDKALDKRIVGNYNVLTNGKMDKGVKIKGTELDTSTDANKIKMINLSDEVRNAMTGNASVSPVIDNLSITNEKYANNSIDYSKLKFAWADAVEYESITIDLINLEVIFNNTTTFFAIENGLISVKQEGSLPITGISGVFVLYLDGNNVVKTGNLYPNNLPEGIKIIAYIYSTSDGMASYKYNVVTKSTNGFKIIDRMEPPKAIPLDNSVSVNKMANPYCYNLLNKSITINLNIKKVMFNSDVYLVCHDKLYSAKNHPEIDFSDLSTNGTLVLTFDPIEKSFQFKTLYPNTMTAGLFILAYIYKENYVDTFLSLDDKGFKLIGFTNSKGCYKWGAIGDSITHANAYQQEVLKKLNIGNYEFNAIVGSCVATNDYPEVAFVDRYLNTSADCDLITIMGGINDCNNNIPIGSINNGDRATYIGGYQEIIEGLLTRNPSVRIMLFTPTPYWKNTTGRPFAGNLINYAEASKEVADYYGLPCLDLYHKMGVNEFTKNELMTDWIHYNAKGYTRMGNLISSFIESNL